MFRQPKAMYLTSKKEFVKRALITITLLEMPINENGAKINKDQDNLLLAHLQADHFTPM